MEIQLNNTLDVKFENDEVTKFIDLMGFIKLSIMNAHNKPGFKIKDKLQLELNEDLQEFVNIFCEKSGIDVSNEVDDQTPNDK